MSDVDLSNCDREPIHQPGSIQSHGCLIVCDAQIRRIVRHSANAANYLGLGTHEIIGSTLETVLGDRPAHDLRNALSESSGPKRAALLTTTIPTSGNLKFAITAHTSKGNVLVEFEAEPVEPQQRAFDIARVAIARIQDAGEIGPLLNTMPRLLRGMLGYDRVMIYQFAEDGSGKVIREVKKNDLESFLGQHFPASDIPQQARKLYLQNTIRSIADVNATVSLVEPVLDAAGDPLDLSFAHLRSVSPIHIEYLKNMGVTASMSISIVVEGQLWGLIACHHYQPRPLKMQERVAAEMLGDVFSLKLDALLQKEALADAVHARNAMNKLLIELTSNEDAATTLRDHLPDFQKLIAADGVGLFMKGTWAGIGRTPPKNTIGRLAKFIGSVNEGKLWATHALASRFAEGASYAADASGVLAIPLSRDAHDFLLFFRPEQVQTLNWAGNPDKQYAVGRFGDRLTPRTSFAIWKQTVDQQSVPWSPRERSIGEALRMQLLEVMLSQSELLAQERRGAELRQRILHDELNHRVKNILALIKSLVAQPVEAGRDIADYVDSLKGRIMALSHAHDQVIRNEGGGQLLDLLQAELSPYRNEQSAIALKGPAIHLDARAFTVLALVFHEIVTNAAKYGALSKVNGHVNVQWRVNDVGDCLIDWQELNGPLVRPPTRRGFGSLLLERSVGYDLGGSTKLDYAPEGFRASLVIPSKFIREDVAANNSPSSALDRTHAAGASFAGKSVLLVEDQLVIALDAEAMLSDMGFQAVETASNPAEALKAIAQKQPDAAVLDINLGTATSFAVAEELQKRTVPFAFATGYGESLIIPPNFKGVPVVRKPYTADALNIALVKASSPAGN